MSPLKIMAPIQKAAIMPCRVKRSDLFLNVVRCGTAHLGQSRRAQADEVAGKACLAHGAGLSVGCDPDAGDALRRDQWHNLLDPVTVCICFQNGAKLGPAGQHIAGQF